MLHISRKKNETITLLNATTGEQLGIISLIDIYKDGTRARLGLDFGQDIKIVRADYSRKEQENAGRNIEADSKRN